MATTVEEGQHIFNKLNVRILSIFVAISAFCYLDRTNLAFASLQLNKDLLFTPQVYGLGSGLFFAGYSLFMIPSNLALIRYGAPFWLSLIITSWGAVATAFSTTSGWLQFYVLRFLLGAAEAGAFPGMWYYLSHTYPPSKITFPLAIVEAAVGLANIVAAPLAAGILLLDGACNLRGWQWLFLLEGVPSVALGLCIRCALPADHYSAHFLTAGEKKWLGVQLAAAKRHEAEAAALGSSQLLRQAAGNRRLWYVSTISILKNSAGNGILFWTPTLLQHMLRNLDRGNAQPDRLQSVDSSWHHAQPVLLAAAPFTAAAVSALLLGHHSQTHGSHHLCIALPMLLASGMMLGFPAALDAHPVLAFALLVVMTTGVLAPNAILNALASAVGQGPAMSVALALYNSVGNVGGLLGPWLIGAALQHTGSYALSFRLLGLMVACAGAMALFTAPWQAGPKVKGPETGDVYIELLALQGRTSTP